MLDFLGAYQYAVQSALIWIIVAYSTYVLLRAGIFAVPQIGLMAIGAYAAGILANKQQAAISLGIAVGGLAGMTSAALLGSLLRKVSGIYLAIASIAFVEIVQILATNLTVTGGAQGLLGVLPLLDSSVLVVVVIAVVLVATAMARGWSGTAIDLLREDELLASHIGVSRARQRIALFAWSGALAGVAGALLAHLSGFVHPGQFGFGAVVNTVAAVIIGGMASAMGPLLGGSIVYGLPIVLVPLGTVSGIINGALLVAVVVAIPGGITSILRIMFRRILREWSPARAMRRPTPSLATPEKPSVEVEESTRPLLSVQGLCHNYGGVEALRDVSLDVYPGEMVGIVGPNGSGKTTLLNIIAGTVSPASGTVHISAQDVTALGGSPHLMARVGVARTFQMIRLARSMSAFTNVLMGGYVRAKARTVPLPLLNLKSARLKTRQLKAEAMERFLDRDSHLPNPDSDAAGLPYGDARRVEFTRALMSHPKLLLLDEPAAGMAPVERADLFRYLRMLASAGLAIIVIEHNLGLLASHCDRIAVLNFGMVLTVDEPGNVVRDPRVIEAYLGTSARS